MMAKYQGHCKTNYLLIKTLVEVLTRSFLYRFENLNLLSRRGGNTDKFVRSFVQTLGEKPV